MVTRTRNQGTERNKTAAVKAAGAATRTSKSASRASGDSPQRKSGGATPSSQRERLIAEAAYYIAEQRGFLPGSEIEDWLQAEREVDLRIRGAMH